jgi:hypothetical protein
MGFEPSANGRRTHTAHPHHIPYNKRCLIKGCESPVYNDGQVYWSVCLLHMQELEFGPFRPRPQTDGDVSL